MLVPDARTAAASFFSGLAHLHIQAPHVRQEVSGKAGAGLPGDAGRRDRSRMRVA